MSFPKYLQSDSTYNEGVSIQQWWGSGLDQAYNPHPLEPAIQHQRQNPP